jgi:bisphosphoglycerate-independent phosphoglycerate mutase (AlkP superfamily)
MLITYNHGNCEESIDKKGRKVTSHSFNPLLCIILDVQYKGEFKIVTTGIIEPGISNVMATFMNLMGYEAPGCMKN